MNSATMNALKSRAALLPGGRDRDERPIILVPVPQEIQGYEKDYLRAALKYISSIFSLESRSRGFAIVVDAQRGSWRSAKTCLRQVTETLEEDEVGRLIVLRPDAFWDKQRVDSYCTKVNANRNAVYIPKSRLTKFVDLSQLPGDLGGHYIYNHEKWIETRLKIEEFTREASDTISELDLLKDHLIANKMLRASEIDKALTVSSDMTDSIKMLVHSVVETGKELIQNIEYDNRSRKFDSDMDSMSTPQDTLDSIGRIERHLSQIYQKQLMINGAWVEMKKSFVDAKDLSKLEEGVVRVTNWVLNHAEALLNAQQTVGYDVASAEELRRSHELLEMECWETYGQYAELLHKIDSHPRTEEKGQLRDLVSQRDFMDFVCRSFATRLERRRNVLITSLRFFRLVSEYYDKTSEVFECLIMENTFQSFEIVREQLHELQRSQVILDAIEREVMKEGEKLSDMLSMPIKDALGRELNVNYEEDIINIRDILDATTARRNIFTDSIELQKLTLEQMAHIDCYETDTNQAIIWLDELYEAMVRSHSSVGCDMAEIQMQKDEHQSFQDTSKSIFNYGCQLLNASLQLRHSCKLPLDDHSDLVEKLKSSWEKLLQASQEQMTRLRVSAIFHRSVEDHCNQLKDLQEAIASMPIEESVKKRIRVKKFMLSREKLLVEVGRMVRLGRLLRTRLREPLHGETKEMSEQSGDGMASSNNESAVEAISEKLAEVTSLAEQLDMALRGAQEDCAPHHSHVATAPSPSMKKIFDGTASTTEEWQQNRSMRSADDDEDFATASEGTLPQSRSSSFNTISECGKYSPWWEMDRTGQDEAASKEKMVLAVGLPQLPSPKTVLKPSPEAPPGKIVHEVTETTHIKVQHNHTLGVSSFVLTSETVRDGKSQGVVVKRDADAVLRPVPEAAEEDDAGLLHRIKEVSKGLKEGKWRKSHYVLSKHPVKNFT